MKPSLTFTIPPNHVAHWRETERGVEVEMLRFITLGEAKVRRAKRYCEPGQEHYDADAITGSAHLLEALREALR